MKRFLFVFLLYLVPVLGIGCSSDPDSPLGSEFIEDGINPSEPGEVFQDTVLIDSGDTSFIVNSAMLQNDRLLFGRRDQVETWMILRPDLSDAGDDTLKQVKSAGLKLRLLSEIDSLSGVFVELAQPLESPDTLTHLELADTIADSTGTNVGRVLTLFPAEHPLDPDVVEGWLNGDRPNNGLAVVLTDTTTVTRMAYASSRNANRDLRPLLRVEFTDTTVSYPMIADGTFSIERYTTSNLLLSDGVTRRVYIPVDLRFFDQRTLLHDARLILHIVPESTTGGDLAVTLYAPDSPDIDDPAVLTGTAVTATFLNTDSGIVIFPIRNIISLRLGDDQYQTALVLRYSL
ncbi:MAG: hypothetical protein P8181_07530 [bacterium]